MPPATSGGNMMPILPLIWGHSHEATDQLVDTHLEIILLSSPRLLKGTLELLYVKTATSESTEVDQINYLANTAVFLLLTISLNMLNIQINVLKQKRTKIEGFGHFSDFNMFLQKHPL